jgi:simple sugar transport system ATP-binding protein
MNPSSSPAHPIIAVKNLHKWYSGVHALKGVTLDFARGETVGLVGDNGAGKSTLINILSGVHAPDKGEISMEGRQINIRNAREAMDLGIETIYQYNSLIPTMSIARNIFIGREPLMFDISGIGIIDQRAMRANSMRAISDVDLHVRSPDDDVSELSGGQSQGVAIARAMYFKSKIMILDEPTNHLSVKETGKVIQFVRGLKAQSVTSIFISHNLHHVFQCCDRVVAMALGKVVLDKNIADTSIDEVSNVM